MIPGTRPLFGYGMNSKALANTQISQPNITQVKANMIAKPSGFVMFSDVRNRSTETPFSDSGSTPDNRYVLASPHCYTTRFSSRHAQGGQIGFNDGHAAYYKYNYMAYAKGTKIGDPGDYDINWSYDGTPSQ